MSRNGSYAFAIACLLVAARHVVAEPPRIADWPGVGNDPGCTRYSSLDQINRQNVTRLKPIWTYHTRELEGRTGKTIECTPIVIDGVMYVTTGYLRVVALDATTGVELWQFDPLKDHRFAHEPASGGVNRGCAYWSDGKPGGERRIIHGTSDGRLFSLDAKNGKLDLRFGDGGIRNLRRELDPKFAGLNYGPTSAPVLWKSTIIVGVSCDEGPGIAAPGDIRAFNVRTGVEVWRFRTVPQPGEFGNDTWEGDSWKDRGGANAWGGLSVDVDRGLVFAGLGSAAFDFHGADRRGDNLFANCTIALDASTGKRVWHFQTLRHDLWDHDLPVYPNLVTVARADKPVDAVAQVTKTGYVFLFDRVTGKPLFDVIDQPVPPSDIPGEQAAHSQPIPLKPPPFSVQFLDESNVTDIGPANRASVLARLRTIRGGPAFNPPSMQGTVVIPGFHGGANWSGASFDPTTGLLYVNSNNVANIITLVATNDADKARYGPYRMTGYEKFLDHEGYSAMKPPWGQLNAINLNTGEFAWRVPLGEHAELTARGVPQTGTETFGGSIVTAGGLVFIAGTMDERIHAFDKQTGRLLWEHPLPAGGYATPATYQVNGRQFIVVAAGGAGKLKTKAGDAFVAFGLESAAEPIVVDLWPGSVPGDVGIKRQETSRIHPSPLVGPTKLITNVTKPTLTIYQPPVEKNNGTAMIICPGGGYWDLYWELEGEEVAAWLNSQGMTGIILKYRCPRRPGDINGEPPLGPQLDAQRAVSVVRGRAAEWGIDPRRIGIVGFSAGGHLAIATATGFARRLYEPIDAIDMVSCRPDFAVACYSGYLKVKDKDEIRPDLKIPPDTPPIFLAHASDDKISYGGSLSENSAIMYLALKRAGVPTELHIYATGDHDFGVRQNEKLPSSWPQLCVKWLRSLGLLRR